MAQQDPFIELRWRGGRAEMSGTASLTLGQRIPATVAGQGDDGTFAGWHWDGRLLRLSNDRYGMLPLFYCLDDTGICVSPSFEAVVRRASKRRFDEAALAVFYRLGHFVGDDTAFADVRTLPPDTELSWCEGRIELVSRPWASAVGSVDTSDFDALVDQYIALFAQAVTRRPPQGRFTVPISGGRDSRHILLELAKQGHLPEVCPTVRYRPPATNQDTQVARQLCDALGIRHESLNYPASFCLAALRDISATQYGGGGHGWVLPVADYVNGHFDSLYDGLAGSVLSGGFMHDERKQQMFASGRLAELAALILDENRQEQGLTRVLNAELAARIPRRLAIERLQQELARHVGARNPLLSFIFWNRTRRCVGGIPYGAYRGVPIVHCPYLDRELFEFLYALDAGVALGNRLHDEVIRRAYPQFADIPYQDKLAKGVFGAGEHDYYQKARRELLTLLRQRVGWRSAVVRPVYLYGQILREMVAQPQSPPWYLRQTLQALEFDALAQA
jgi:hypothetical protein